MRSAIRGTLACFAVLAAACGGSGGTLNDAVSGETSAAAVSPGGRIKGAVRFAGDMPEPAVQPVTKDTEVCGRQISLTRLALGKRGGVRRAFVYLEDAPGRAPLQSRAVLVDQKQCEYVPKMMAMAAGAPLEIVNSDPILHNVHARARAVDGLQTLFNIAQPLRGQRTSVDASLMKPGIVALTCEAGHPWMTAYVFVAQHPYVAVTNDEGEFVIDGVPAGTYRIKMWHEGVRLNRIIESLQRYEYEDPYEVVKQITVTSSGEALVDFELALRPVAPRS